MIDDLQIENPIPTESRTPIPAKMTFAGENTYKNSHVRMKILPNPNPEMGHEILTMPTTSQSVAENA
jgi:hypothetical protein